MSENKPTSARDKIAKLRLSFLEQLPERVAQVRALFERFKADPSDQAAIIELHRHLHNLKGTGRSFGFEELGGSAGHSENLASELLEAPAKPFPVDWQERMGKHIEYIEMTAAVISADKGGDFSSGTPSFSLPAFTPKDAEHKGGHTVYICDDEELTLEKLASQLDCFGYKCKRFTDPQALHDAVLAKWPDGVIMDIHFPQGHDAGTEMLATLKQETGKTVPAIFLSARNDFGARLNAVQAGGQAFFHKPADIMDLVVALDGLTRQQQPGAYRILVVDDEAEIASYHCILLQEAGMLTCALSDASRILETLNEFRPDLVLLDMYLPQCNGRDLASLIRQVPDYVSLPIVYLSSEADQKKQFSAMRIGAEGFLTKPVIPEELIEAVSIRAERMRVLRSLMARDSLTGLFNHTATTQFIENTLATARRINGSMCFVMIDIDYFKLVNDTHGHPAGDQVLLALARLLQQRLRTSDVIGRYGGEEFAVILQDVPIARAAELMEELRQAFSRIRFNSKKGDFYCTFSAGIACYPNHDRMEYLREAADTALYDAKHKGRNCIIADMSKTRIESDQ